MGDMADDDLDTMELADQGHRELSRETSQELVDKYLHTVVETTDAMLADFGLDHLNQLLAQMKKTQSTARAVAGIMVPLDAVDEREVKLGFFESIVNMARARNHQRTVMTKLQGSAAAAESMRRMFGL